MNFAAGLEVAGAQRGVGKTPSTLKTEYSKSHSEAGGKGESQWKMRHVGKGALATIQSQVISTTDAVMARVVGISARAVGSGGSRSMGRHAVSTLSPLPTP